MRKPLNLRQLLTLVITVLTCSLIGLVMLTIGRAGVRRVEAEIGDQVRLLADQMQDKFDRTLYERYREIETAARLFHTLSAAERPEGTKAWLEQLQKSYPDYAWIGFVRRDGSVARATHDHLVGTNVADQPWFKAGMQRTTIGDVHEDPALARLLPYRGDATPRFLDIASPLSNAAGTTVGVLCAQLDWNWADEVRGSLFGATPAGKSEEVLVLTSTGVVLLGPRALTGSVLPLASVRGAIEGRRHSAIEEWPDGHRYVTGYAQSNGHRSFPGVGWIILVRQDAEVALASARHLQLQFLAWSVGLAGLAALTAWMLSGWIAAPMLVLANSADAIRRGDDVRVPDVSHYAEAETLSQSLKSLVAELKLRQGELERLNHSLEQQVAQRTSELAARNALLARAKNDAEEATAAKSRFLATASHDLRQPLHAMTLFASALARRVSGAEAPRLVAQLESALKALRGMFDALLDVSRLDAGMITPVMTEVSVAELLNRIAEGCRAEAETRGLRFRLHVIDATVATDSSLLETMLRNLTSNALKFTKHGGLLLAARRRAGQIEFSVIDTGPGIQPAHQMDVFREFARSQQHATGANDGLGLGLSIVRRYAALLGAKIDLASRVGHGTRISLMLPEANRTLYSPLTPQRIHSGLSGVDAQHLSGARILLIDDDPPIVAAMAQELEDQGCRPLWYPTLSETEAVLQAGVDFDVAIVDFDLGGGRNGPGLVETAERKLGRHIPTLFITGGTDAKTLTELMATGRPWLTKPASPEAVRNALARLIPQHPAQAPPVEDQAPSTGPS